MSDRRTKPLIIPVFIPYQGCPHRCIFCDQERITSQQRQRVDKEHVEQILETAIHSKKFDPSRKPEIAFYGGTFTNLPIARMQELLDAAKPFISKGYFNNIRISTRPDAIDKRRLAAIKASGVTTVELGAQSMDDHVLDLSKRGHSSEDTVKAVKLLRAFGFQVGIQLMPGLPGDSRERFYSTVTKVLMLRPDMVRLYPAVVIRGTELAELYKKDAYQPLDLDAAVEICMENCMRLEDQGISVIRIGLMSSPSFLEEGQIIAGPWHPAFGFLVRSGIYRRNIDSQLRDLSQGASRIIIIVSSRDVPLIRGYQNQGLKEIQDSMGVQIVKIEVNDLVPLGEIQVQKI